MGKWISERGMTFVDVDRAGHEMPQFNPSAALGLLEVWLGRMDVESGLLEWAIDLIISLTSRGRDYNVNECPRFHSREQVFQLPGHFFY